MNPGPWRHVWRASVCTGVLVALAGLAYLAIRGNQYHYLMRSAGAVERIAKHWRIQWLEQFAWKEERQFFLGSLAWQVERGELAVVKIPPQSVLDPKIFFPELRDFSRRNHLRLAFMQSDQTASGLFSFAIYVRTVDRGTIQEFIERQKGVLTSGSSQ